jgi:hypothetical protein
MKVCSHCAEELPDEAAVRPDCHKDPAASVPSAMGQPPGEPEPWSFEDARELARSATT